MTDIVEKCQCWLCANEKAAQAAEIERLRAALRGVMQEAERHHAENITRAELGGSDMAQRKAKAIVSRSGVLLHSIKGIAAALNAWPGMQHRIHIEQAIIIPLPEGRDD